LAEQSRYHRPEQRISITNVASLFLYYFLFSPLSKVNVKHEFSIHRRPARYPAHFCGFAMKWTFDKLARQRSIFPAALSSGRYSAPRAPARCGME
jgi:hypothetical protein